MGKQFISLFGLFLAGFFVMGCASTPRPQVTVELTGTEGASVEGYYVRDGKRTQILTSLPLTISGPGITQVAVRKVKFDDDLSVYVKSLDGEASTRAEPGIGDGLLVDVADGMSCDVIPANVSLHAPGNSVMVISPYRHGETWVFDDPGVGLRQEPFVSGVPEMIDDLVTDIPAARDKGFRLTFSGTPFPGHQRRLTWVRAETGGNVYRMDGSPMQGWLCPAMFRYFKKAPKHLYVRADAKPA